MDFLSNLLISNFLFITLNIVKMKETQQVETKIFGTLYSGFICLFEIDILYTKKALPNNNMAAVMTYTDNTMQ